MLSSVFGESGNVIVGGVLGAAALVALAKKVPWFQVAYRAYRFPPIGRRIQERALAAAPPAPAQSLAHRCNTATVVTIPFGRDNFAYLARCTATGAMALIDPADPSTCIAAVNAHRSVKGSGLGDDSGGSLEAVLCTHWHFDHSFGNAPVRRAFPGCKVYGPRADSVPDVDTPVDIGEVVRVGNLEFEVLRGTGHTRGGAMFLLRNAQPAVVFTGDCVFSGGIGALFECDAAVMAETLGSFASLPPSTEVLPGHEYTVPSLEFASAVVPGDRAVEARLAWARARALMTPPRPTVPSTVAEELRHNLFLRTTDTAVTKAALAAHEKLGLSFESSKAPGWPEPVRVLAALREIKDAGFGDVTAAAEKKE